MYQYFNGEIVEQSQIKISPFDRGFQFSDGVYEVIRYYPKTFFKLEAHLDRLKYSLNELDIPVPQLNNIDSVLYELISKNNLIDELSIAYIQVTRGNQFPRKHSFADQLSPTFFIYVEKMLPNKIAMKNGIKVGLEEDIRWHRCDIKTTSLIPNVLSITRAVKNGLSEIIYHRNGNITEGTHTNICFAKKNILITPPLSNFILAGITRKVVFEICANVGIVISERNVSVEELKDFDEIFILGTTTEITPVIEINGMKISGGRVGSICRLLQTEYEKLHYQK